MGATGKGKGVGKTRGNAARTRVGSPEATVPEATSPEAAEPKRTATETATPRLPGAQANAADSGAASAEPDGMASRMADGASRMADGASRMGDGAGLPCGAGQLTALAATNAALLRGCEELSREIAGQAREAVEAAARAARALLAVRTAADLLAVNRECAQAALEGLLVHGARVSEIGIRTALRALAPLDENVSRQSKPLAD